jgi:hypothetical protein
VREKLAHGMRRRILWIALVMAAGCVDLSRPSSTEVDVLPGARDAPAEASPGDRPVDMVTDTPELDGTVPVDTDDGSAPVDAGPEALPPDAPPDLPLITNGNPCTLGAQCASTFCASGVCCDSTCTGLCQTCNVAGKLGQCSPVPAGEDPRDNCPRDPPSSCAFDGSCNGNGSCQRYPATTECAPGSCTGSTEQAASTCNGNGTCVAGATRSCSPNLCMGPSCGATCSGDGQCQTGFFCEANKCNVKRAQGASCTTGNQCATGICVDGVCCASQCTPNCFACNIAGQLGTCVAVPGGQDPRNVCPAQAAGTCGRLGACDGSGACRLHPMGTLCSATSCTGSTETAASTCNGLGTCAPGGTRSCGLYVCGAGACNGTCTAAAQCQPGVACTSNACSVLPGLVLFWRLEESSGTVAADSSGNGFNGTYTGVNGTPTTSTIVPPQVRYTNTRSRDFVLANRQAIRLPSFPAALKPANNLTLATWYRATPAALDGDGSELMSAGDAYNIRIGPTQIETSKDVGVGTHSFQDCRVTVAGYLDGGWHHVAVVFSASGITVYFDGTARTGTTPGCANTQSISYSLAGPDFWVGRHGFDPAKPYNFGGGIDELRIYNRALSAAEIQHLAGGGS